MISIIGTPSAWVPILMSIFAFIWVIGYIIIVGAQNPQAEEGIATHIHQILIAGQLPLIIYFAIKWIPKEPKQSFQVISLQIISALLAPTLVFFLKL